MPLLLFLGNQVQLVGPKLWPVTLLTGGNTGQALNYATATCALHYGMTPFPVAQVVGNNNGNGSINLLPPGGATGQLSSTNLAGGSTTSTQLGSNQAVSGPNVKPLVYSTNQTNAYLSLNSTTQWANAAGTGIATGSTLTSGNTYYWNTGSSGYTGSAIPYAASYTLPASGNALFVFQHTLYQSGASGTPRILFTGSSAGGATNSQASTGISGSSTCSDSGGGHYNTKTDTYMAPFTYASTNGAVVSHQATTSVGPSGTNPIKLVLNSVNCPAGGDGSASLTVTLLDTTGTIINSNASFTVTGSGTISTGTAITGITGATTIQYAPTVANSAGTYTWHVQAINVNNDTAADVPYWDTYPCTWNGTILYWTTTGASGNTYVLGSDGTTQRLSTSDSNVQFFALSADTIGIKVFNNSATNALSFTLGMDVSGL